LLIKTLVESLITTLYRILNPQFSPSPIVSQPRPYYICPREPLDQKGTVGSLHYSGIAPDWLGRKGLSSCPSASGYRSTYQTLIMHEVSFEEALVLIRAKDPRYACEAYLFIKDALDHTQKA